MSARKKVTVVGLGTIGGARTPGLYTLGKRGDRHACPERSRGVGVRA